MISHKGIPLTQDQINACIPVINENMATGKSMQNSKFIKRCEDAMASAGCPFNPQPQKTYPNINPSEQLDLVCQLTEKFKSEFADLLRKGGIPKDWNRREICHWLSQKFEGESFSKKPA